MDHITRQFINLTKKFRKELRLLISKLNRALDRQTEAVTKSASQRQECPPPEVTIFNNLPSTIQVQKDAQDAEDERNYKRFTFLVAALTLGALIVYADLVYDQYAEMIAARAQAQAALRVAFNQFDLSRQQLIHTQAAMLTPLLQLNISSNGSEATTLLIELMNDGHERADGVTGAFQIFEYAAATGDLIGKRLPVTITSPYGLAPIQDLEPMRQRGKNANNSYAERFTLPISDKLVKMIENADVTVAAEGTISYNDGFEHKSDSFCFRYINYSSVKRNSFPYNFVDCSDFQSALSSAQRARDYELQGK